MTSLEEKIKKMIIKGYSDRRIARTLGMKRREIVEIRTKLNSKDYESVKISSAESFKLPSPSIYQPTGVKEAIRTRIDSSLSSTCNKCGLVDSRGDEGTGCNICGKYHCFKCYYCNTSEDWKCPSGCDDKDHCFKCIHSKPEDFLDPDTYYCILYNKTIIDPLIEVCPDFKEEEQDF